MHYTATAAGGEDSRIRHETQRKSAAAAYSGAAARRSYAARAERRSVGRSVGRTNEEFSFHTWRLLTVKSAATAASRARPCVCKLL